MAVGSRAFYSAGVSDLLDVAQRLRGDELRDALDVLCRRYDISLLVLFGSAAAGNPSPRDIDVAARFDPYDPGAVLAFLDELADAAGTDRVDLLVLNTAGPVAREEALVFGTPLFLASPDLLAEAQIAATMERLDTDVLRRQELEMLRTS